ncbi:hypothetical protein Aasi_1128 [Candidatus Amoebophilus asiaticus 5a2]|uniref:Purine nucleoside phosphorylase n=1 Tax=Amoebophilus asiaticus (strain 5a2) TaxID=452471 RepID=B3ETB5_AMOA5|nr:peptidoglycan editing factor PgeF [Candidatus Amoebophilus asiaticus]ACE06467.1 hypothetical protein Aasi_1128 [Candidatus Amoebophilus asiaticus 5a2]
MKLSNIHIQKATKKKETIFMYTAPSLSKQAKLAHGFFTRIGGVSTSVYSSLNCQANCNDNPENIVTNQSLVCSAVGFNYNDLRILDQIHSASVITIHNKEKTTSCLQADALVTSLSGILLGIRTADCVPILFFDSKNKVIAAAHAGWKGTVAGVIENTILAMQNLGAEVPNILTSIGPCIQQSFYEIDQAFYGGIVEQNNSYERFFIRSKQADHYMFDLPGYCVEKLQQVGVKTIDNLEIDTYSNPNILFSFRRAAHENKNSSKRAECGRQLSVIGML